MTTLWGAMTHQMSASQQSDLRHEVALVGQPVFVIVAILIPRSFKERIAPDRGAVNQNRVGREALTGEIPTI
jgi:hypothetical protein